MTKRVSDDSHVLPAVTSPRSQAMGGARQLVVAALIPVAACALQGWLWWVIQPLSWTLFYPAVFISSRLGGLRGGLLATFLSTLLAWYFFLPPYFSFAVEDPVIFGQMGIFVCMGVLFSLTHERLRLSNRKVAESLAGSDLKLRAAMASMTDAVFISDSAGRFVEFNEAFATFHKFRNKDECAKTLAEYPAFLEVFLPNGNLAPLEQWAVPRALRGETADSAEYVLRRKDTGETWTGNYSFAPIRDEKGLVVGSVVTARDITERKRAEAETRRLIATVQQEKDRLTSLVNSISDEVWFADTHKRFTLANPSALREFGLEANAKVDVEQLAASLEVLRPDGTARPVEEAPPLRALLGETVRDLEEVIRTPASGEVRYRQVSSAPVRDPGGAIIGSVSVVRDITDRKRAEAALRESEERFRAMADSMAQLAWIAKPDGFIFWYNQRWYAYTGTTPEQMEGWGWQSVHDPQVLPEVMDKWQNAIAAGAPFHMEFPLRGADGHFRTFLTRGQPLKDSQGRVVQWFGTNTDVDELKRTQQELQLLNVELEQRVGERTAALAMVNKELETFAYSVSHDLRAPLRSIDGFSRLVVKQCADKLDEESRDNLNRVRAASQRMGELIDDLLKLSRAGRAEINCVPVDCSALACDVLAALKQTDPSRRVNCVVSPGLSATADRSLLRAVLENLLGNAWKFTGRQPDARIEFGTVERDGEPAFFVRDNGAGFDPEYVAKLFTPFQRLHSQSEFTGSGIGLATVQRIILRHRGRVWAEGQVNQGATFYFTLPANPT